MNNLKILLTVILVSCLLVPVTVTLASDITDADYRGIVQATNNGTLAENVAANFSLGTDELIMAGQLNSGATNVVARDQNGNDVVFMPGYGDNPWIIFYDSIAAGTSQSAYIYTGNVSGGLLRYFPGNYGMTVTDAATLEWGNSGFLYLSGYFDTTATGENITSHGPFNVSYPSSGTIQAAIGNLGEDLLYYDGTGDYCHKDAGVTSPAGSNMTIEAWVYKDGLQVSGTRYYIYNAGDANVGTNNHRLQIDNNGKLSFYLTDNAGNPIADWTSTNNLTPDKWHYIAATYDTTAATSVVVYDNGSPMAGADVGIGGVFVAQAARLGVGAFYHGGAGGWQNYWLGWIDEVRISNGMLSATEIQNNYTTQCELSVTANTTALFHFNTGSGGTAYDETGNNDLSIVNATWDTWRVSPLISLSSITSDEYELNLTLSHPFLSIGLDSTDTVTSRNRIARLYRDGTNNPEAYFTQEAIGAGQSIIYKFKKDTNAKLHIDHGNGTKYIRVKVDTDEHIYYYDGANHDTGSVISIDTWYQLKINNVDWTAGTYDIYLDNVLIQAAATMGAAASYNDQVYFLNDAGTSEAWIDDITITGSVSEYFEWGYVGDSLDESGGDITWTVSVAGASKAEIDAEDALVFNAPLFQEVECSGNFTSVDTNEISCNVTNATWTSDGYDFDGSGDFINCGNSTALNNLGTVGDYKFSLETYIYLTSGGELNSGRILSKGGSALTRGFELYCDFANTRLLFTVYQGGVGKTASTSVGTISLSTWYHVVAVYDGSQIRIYLNTTPNTPATIAGAIDNHAADNLYIASRSGVDRWYDGLIPEVRIYNIALTADQIEANYNATCKRYTGTGDVDTHSTIFSVPDDTDDWLFCTGGSVLYMESVSISVGGTPVSAWEWEYDTTFHDSIGANDATPTFRTTSSDSDVTAVLISFLPLNQSVADPEVISSWPSMIEEAPEQPETMYTENESPGIFFAPFIEAIWPDDIPISVFWYNFSFAIIIASSILTYYFFASKGQNALLLKCIISTAVMVGFALPGPNVYGFYVVIYHIFWCFGIIVLSRNYGW